MARVRWMLPAGLACLALALVAAPEPARAESRVALVIGNSNYGGELGVLKNPVNDAKLVAQSLRNVGFTVIEAEDADLQAMRRAISEFGQQLSAAGEGATGLFFFAGHGVQVGGSNYLVPVHAEIKREADVDLEAVSAETVLKQMAFAESAVNIVILDACRNNPLTRGFRDVTNGLADMRVKPRGTFISYSTAPGDVAADGEGANSPYSAALAAEIVKPGSINDVFQAVRGDVMKATNAKQIPWDSSSLTAPFYFTAPTATGESGTAGKTAPSTDPALEIAFWNSIKDSNNAKDFEAYLKRFPGGTFADLAANKLDALQAGGTPGTEIVETSPPAGGGEQAVTLETGDAQDGALVAGGTSLSSPTVVTTRGEPPPEQLATLMPSQPDAEQPTIAAAQLPPEIAALQGVLARVRKLGGLSIEIGPTSHDDNGNIVLQLIANNETDAPIYVATFDLGIVATTDRGGMSDMIAWINLPLCNVLSGCTDNPEDWAVVEPGKPLPFAIALQELAAQGVNSINLAAHIVTGALDDSQRVKTSAAYPLFFAAIPAENANAIEAPLYSQEVDGIRYDVIQAHADQTRGSMMLAMTNTTDRDLWVRLMARPDLRETMPDAVKLKPRFYALSVCDASSPTAAKCATKDPLLWAMLPPGLPLGVPFTLPAQDPPIQALDLKMQVIQAPGDLASGRKQAKASAVDINGIMVRP